VTAGMQHANMCTRDTLHPVPHMHVGLKQSYLTTHTYIHRISHKEEATYSKHQSHGRYTAPFPCRKEGGGGLPRTSREAMLWEVCLKKEKCKDGSVVAPSGRIRHVTTHHIVPAHWPP
jgi:hypothetical protein